MSVDKPLGMPDLPDGWHWDYFENLCVKVSVGHVGETSSFFTTKENGIPFIRSQNVRPGKLVLDDIKYITREFHKKSKKSQLLAGDILIVRVGQNRGDCCVLPENTCEINCANIVFGRLNNLKYSNYIGYFFNSELGRAALLAVSSGSAQGVLNTKAIAKVVVPVPPMEIAEDVGFKLASFDNKIELNRQINQTLEQIAQAIFKSWFVDFEPVKAKIEAKQNGQDPERAAMRAISGKTDEELNALTPEQRQQLTTAAALFPDELEDDAQGSASAAEGRTPGAASELGEIPKGWEIKPLSQMIELIGGGTPKRSEESYWGGDIPWFSVKDAPAAGDVFVIDTDEKITELGLNKSSTKLLPKGVTIISARGTVGRLAMIGVPMAMNQSCYGVKAGTGLAAVFNYFNLKHAILSLQQQTHGAVFDTITTKTFSSVYAVQPCINCAKEFEIFAAPLLRRIKNNLFENTSLIECRDLLLPKLLSGELSTGNTQTKAEAVA